MVFSGSMRFFSVAQGLQGLAENLSSDRVLLEKQPRERKYAVTLIRIQINFCLSVEERSVVMRKWISETASK